MEKEEGFNKTKYMYAAKISPLPTCSNDDAFRSLRHNMAWIGHTRQEIVAPVNILSQPIDRTFEARHIRLINGLVRRVRTAKKGAYETQSVTRQAQDGSYLLTLPSRILIILQLN